ncbi:Uncharacterized protein FKW44_005824, partial [Caligus rogercresseyi]
MELWNRQAAVYKGSLQRPGLWNLHNRSSVVANKIKDVVCRKLKTPCPTSVPPGDGGQGPRDHGGHNDAIKSEAVGNWAAVPAFTEDDKEILQEYCKVIKPVAICLDRLQAEVNAYIGILLPYLMLLKRELQAIKREGELRYAGPLVDALLEQDGNVHGFNN